MTANISRWLPEQARDRGNATAVIDSRSGATHTFRDLDSESDALARGLGQLGLAPGQRVVLMVPPGFPFFALTFALFKAGAIPVLIDPGMGVRGLGKCIDEADADLFIGSTKAQVARLLFGWCRARPPRCVWVGPSLPGAMNLRQVLGLGRAGGPVLAELDDSSPAAILFTSGSTGPAKGAMYTHGMFQEQVRVLRESLGIEPGEVDLCTFPLFALFAPALGMTAVVPTMDPTRPARADPRMLIAAVERYRVTNLFGSPALINVLSRYGEKHGINLPTLRRVLSAGAPVAPAVIARMTAMLPADAPVYTPYGATESLPVALIRGDEILSETRALSELGAGVCVGRTVGRVEVRIIPVSPGPLAELPAALPKGQRGEITVSGPVVSSGYWKRPEADAVHKIRSEGRIWHRTGDLGYFDQQGRLWFCGRKAHRVETPAGAIFDTIPVEAVFNVLPWVARSALVGVRGRPVVCIECNGAAPANYLKQLRDVAASHEHTREITEFLIYLKPFPVDVRHNAKIFREKLAEWAAGRLP
ncbi:MAG: AMP-binding protein [Gemmataceae bacterium]|nr:AMP-binding protein [Gemmataceae bacterium]